MLEVIGEPTVLAKADKIYAATHRVVVEEVRPQRDPDSKFWNLCKSRTQKFRDFQHRREIPTQVSGLRLICSVLGRASSPVRIAWTA